MSEYVNKQTSYQKHSHNPCENVFVNLFGCSLIRSWKLEIEIEVEVEIELVMVARVSSKRMVKYCTIFVRMLNHNTTNQVRNTCVVVV